MLKDHGLSKFSIVQVNVTKSVTDVLDVITYPLS